MAPQAKQAIFASYRQGVSSDIGKLSPILLGKNYATSRIRGCLFGKYSRGMQCLRRSGVKRRLVENT